MSFEQRRGNVDGFFGLPRFGAARQFPEQRNKRAVSSGDRKEDAEDEIGVGVEIDERRSFEADDEARVGVNRAEVHESRRSNAEIVVLASDAEKENIVVAEGDQYSNVEKHDGKPRRARAEAGEEGTKVVDGEIGEDEKDEEGGRSKKEKTTGAEHAQDSRCHRYGGDFCPNTVHDTDGGDRWGTAEISIHQETGGQLGQGAAAAKVRIFRMVQQRPVEIGEERKDLSDGGQLRYARRR